MKVFRFAYIVLSVKLSKAEEETCDIDWHSVKLLCSLVFRV